MLQQPLVVVHRYVKVLIVGEGSLQPGKNFAVKPGVRNTMFTVYSLEEIAFTEMVSETQC